MKHAKGLEGPGHGPRMILRSFRGDQHSRRASDGASSCSLHLEAKEEEEAMTLSCGIKTGRHTQSWLKIILCAAG